MPYDFFTVTNTDNDTRARTGILRLPHGDVTTPAFMPVGTNAAVKAIGPDEIESIGCTLILSNAYHLYLRPGLEVIKNAGGLHSFMSWKHNILTDSGGYQVFSLAPFRKIEEKGVYFRSHIDGSYHRLSPVDVIKIQATLGSDICMPLDICTPPGITLNAALEAVMGTHKWAAETIEYVTGRPEGEIGRVFAIIQGNFFPELRKLSTDQLVALDFPGYAIGGLSVGEEFGHFRDILAMTAAWMPAAKPRYLMGVGTPEYILEACENGIDLFDCVFPTRIARNACAFTKNGTLSLRLERNRLDNSPIDEGCECHTCTHFSRSYLRHLFKAREINAAVYTTYHNLFFIQKLIFAIRDAIEKDEFLRFKKDFLSTYTTKS